MPESTSPIPDPLASWRAWIGQSEQQWNAFFNQAMGSDQYTRALGRMMETYVATQKSLADGMGRYLSALNLPTRTDILMLGDRLAMIEDRLAGIERMLAASGIADPAPAGDASPVARPPRTKQPPARAAGPGETAA